VHHVHRHLAGDLGQWRVAGQDHHQNSRAILTAIELRPWGRRLGPCDLLRPRWLLGRWRCGGRLFRFGAL
ncbi:unnamed protein product, partial [Ixodes pacificus]